MRLEGDGSSSDHKMLLEPSATMNDLPSEVMKNIFSFVGKGNYCFVAPVSKDFCFNYLTMDVIEDKFAHKMDYLQAIGKNKLTTVEAASSSFQMAEYCFFKAPERFQWKTLRKAIRKGRTDIAYIGHAMGIDVKEVTRYYTGGIFREIAQKGNLEMFKLLLEKGVDIHSTVKSKFIIRDAASSNQLQLLKWLHRNNVCQDEHKSIVFMEAVKSDNVQLFQWAQNVFNCRNATARIELVERNDLINVATESDGLELIQYFRSQQLSWGEQTFRIAARIGNIALLEYLLENGCSHDDPLICSNAIEINNHEKASEVLKWLHEHNIPWNEKTCATAAGKGNLIALKYARLNGCPWNAECLEKAVNSCNLEVVEFCLQNGCPIGNRDICSIAIRDKDHDRALKMLKVLREFSVPWSSKTCSVAASVGNFTALKWCVSHGCGWDRKRCANYAAGRGNIETLKWMRSQGCEWSDGIGASAAYKGHIETLKFLRSQGCPMGRNTFLHAISSKKIATVEYCIENDVPFDEELYQRAIDVLPDPIPIIKLLRDSGYPWHPSACAQAATNEDLKLLRWLRFNGCPWDESVCNEAVKYSNLQILKYARENGCAWSKKTYAYCFSEDGLENEFYDIPTADDIECSKEIFEYIQEQKCPKPDSSDWNITF
ncbi:hypothetical protein CTEN210_09796 [Chaetoceros tenuissimus]|uniref:Uncharacterized protein n=1 Tax=Chaetoceros tenuissimus TaxID=426638 RepID=A0AAD3CYM6_9STRA|nr:hypothetical protein CTEN210_09796 [Chaetoceros tenuissimus]